MRLSVRSKSSSGFTIVELMLATGLVSLFFLLGSSVISQLFAFQKDVNKRLMDDFSVVNFHKFLTRDLEGSYWARYGLFACPSSKDLMETVSASSATVAPGDMLEFVTSDFSSTVGQIPGTTKIGVATLRNLQVGDLVLLSLGADASASSVFKIDVVDYANSQVELSPSNLGYAGTACSVLTPSKPLSDFFGPAANSSVFLTRIRVIQYAVTPSGELTRAVLPGGAESIVTGMNKLVVKSKWSTSADDATSAKKIGQMNFTVDLNFEQSTLMGNGAKKSQDQKLTAQYSLDSFSYANKYAKTGVPDIGKKFPTCAVGYNFQPGVFNIAPGDSSFNNTVPISLTGYISESMDGATIDISFTPLAGGSILCYLHNPNSGGYPSSGTLLSDNGKTAGVTLKKDGSQYETYSCAVKGRIALTASMSYYENQISQVKTVNCSAEQIVAPTSYKLNGPKPTCNSTWVSWNMQSEIVSVDGDASQRISLGMFSVDMNKSCLWGNDSSAQSDISGEASSCSDWDPANAGKHLKRIYLRPYKQPVLNEAGTANAFSGPGNYIDCN